MDRRWMYDRNFPGRRGLKQEFVDGVEEFINIVKDKPIVISEGGIRCPCTKCKCGRTRSIEEIKSHLYHHGFKPRYWVWTSHGETILPSMDIVHAAVERNDDAGPSNNNFVPNVQNNQEFETMTDMISNALGVNVSFNEPQYDDTDQLPNEQAQRFYCLLKETNTPLFEGSTESKLSMCVRLLGLKSQFQVPDLALDLMTKLMLDATPIKDDLPQSYYDAKQLVSKLGLDVKRIDCCVHGCMLYYDNEFGIHDGDLVECRHCKEPRYYVKNNSRSSRSKLVPRKAMFYLPIVTRLQRMFASMQTAGKMTWHYENRSSSGELRHPSDGEAWKHFDRVHPTFARDPRNVRLGLCSDGFTPYIQASATPYSCWPVIVTPYNLPPDMCMSKPYMFLAAVIPGPHNPTAGIDIFLQPLVDDLKRLWNGVITYDIARKEIFLMRAALMWTINDFPAYGMLSGWGTHGKMACPVCMEDTKAFQLKYGGKTSWFDSHRRYLPRDHPFRRNKTAFLKGCVETLGPPTKLTSEQVWDKVKDVPRVKVVKGVVQKPPEYGHEHHWIKRSIFWDLPYWKDNLLRHNLDVMHIEKNFFDNIFNTVMNVKGKTKDNDKARKDLNVFCKRPELLLVEQNNGKYLKPHANYTLKPEDVKSVYQWIKDLKMPDGYSSNIARCADVEKERMHGMKSHDCHVFMECLLPIAFSRLPTHVLNPLVEVSQFFKNLCSATLKEEDLIKMENDIPVILCKLEKVFPPGFFDSMEHLPVHLASEARLGGPVQYRWMYPFERYVLKIHLSNICICIHFSNIYVYNYIYIYIGLWVIQSGR